MSLRVAYRIALSAIVLALLTAAQGQSYQVIHNFAGPDGQFPYSTLTADQFGNLYGTTNGGGGGGCLGPGCGTVFKLSRRNSIWQLTRLYSFRGGFDGELPLAGVVFGPDGALYGTTTYGGGGCPIGCGSVYRLTPPANACGTALCSWHETILYRFTGGSDGGYPSPGNLAFDRQGNLWGTTTGDQNAVPATLYKLTHTNGGWTFGVAANFGGQFVYSGVTFDSAGNLYGAVGTGGSTGNGFLYEFTPSGSGGTLTNIFNFQQSTGSDPLGTPVFDSDGNLYGTTFHNGGEIYELSPAGGQWSFTSLHQFDEYDVFFSGPTLDSAGNVYGALQGGVIVELLRAQNWSEVDLHDFLDDLIPFGGVTLDAAGNVYGTTVYGGTGACEGGQGCGVIYEITP